MKKQHKDPEITAPRIPPTLEEEAMRFRRGENVTFTPKVEAGEQIKKRRSFFRKSIFAPIASVVAVATVVTAATGVRPIGGNDFDEEPHMHESIQYFFEELPDEITMYVSEETDRYMSWFGDMIDFSYRSGDSSVASFDREGRLIAHSPGKTSIVISCDLLMMQKRIEVTVLDELVFEVPEELYMHVGESMTVYPVVKNKNDPHDKNAVQFYYESSDPSVVTVTNYGGELFAKSPGDAAVTVRPSNLPDTPLRTIRVHVEGEEEQSYTLDRDSFMMYTYDSIIPELTLLGPDGQPFDAELRFEPVNGIIRIGDGDGMFLFISEGETGEALVRVTAVGLDFEETIYVSVVEPEIVMNEVFEMTVGDVFQIDPHLYPVDSEPEHGDFYYSVSDPTVLSVSADGGVTALAEGSAEVTVSLSWPVVSRSFRITVSADNATVTHEHQYSGMEYDENRHWKTCTLCGETADAGEHVFGGPVASEDGHCYRCSVCSYTTASVEHTPLTEPAVPATCTADGMTEGSVCAVCKQVLSERKTIPATGHTVAVDSAVPATCTEAGLTEGSHCTVCGEVIKEQTMIPAPGHSFGAWTVSKEATDDGEGEETRVCAVCGESQTRKIDPAGHEYSATVTPPTCTAQGYTTHRCVTCGDEYIDSYTAALGHDFGAWSETTAATCTRNGSETRVCSRCGVTESRDLAATGHTPVADAPIAATCTEAGKTEGSHCSVCGAVIKAQTGIPATGHTVVTDPKIPATCTTSGKTEGSHCSVCGTVLQKQFGIPKKGHTEVTDAAVAATCTTSGKTEGSHCSVCGAVIKAQTEIPAAGHTVVTDAAVAATCTEAGITAGSHCSVCGTVFKAQKEIPATGHTVVTDPKIPATCTTSGKTEGSHCSVCGTVLEKQFGIPKKGHSYETATGVCSRCGDKLATVTMDGETILTPGETNAVRAGNPFGLSAALKSGATYDERAGAWSTNAPAGTTEALLIRSSEGTACTVYPYSTGSGEIVLTFVYDGVTYTLSFLFTVTEAPNLTLSERSVSMYVGDTHTVKATLTGSDASIRYTGSDKSVFTVNSKGVLTAVGKGSATLTVSCPDEGLSRTLQVTVETPPWDTAAPKLDNPDPASESATGAMPSIYYNSGNDYISYERDSDGNWNKRSMGLEDADFVYDPSTNTLTFSGLKGGELSVSAMGSGFRIKPVGSNSLDRVFSEGGGHSGCITFTGTGSLEINADRSCIWGVEIVDYAYNGDPHEACMIVEGGVSLTVHGGDSAAATGGAVIVRNTSLEKGIYTLARITLSGGAPEFMDEYGNYTVLDSSGAVAQDVYFIPA
ncbi:MAG: Ig-like domain-containing protein [Clostridia bacterium]|nr:Ig-like domain-containing protein [Clostridia bacterium]